MLIAQSVRVQLKIPQLMCRQRPRNQNIYKYNILINTRYLDVYMYMYFVLRQCC